jgi:hypothetical protein
VGLVRGTDLNHGSRVSLWAISGPPVRSVKERPEANSTALTTPRINRKAATNVPANTHLKPNRSVSRFHNATSQKSGV